MPPGTRLTGKVHQSGRAEWVDGSFASARITHTFDRHIAAENVRRVMAVPLVREGETLGVLAVQARTEGTFSDREVDRA